MDFETEIVFTQQSYETELKWGYKTICNFYRILWKGWVLWHNTNELCKQHVDITLNVKLFWSFGRLIQKFKDMLYC
jgi:hypothetical protein